MKRKKHGWIWLIVLAVLVAAGFFGWQYLNRQMQQTAEMAEAAMQRSYTVERGDIETVVVANGTLAATETVPVTAPDGILVTEVLVSAGEEVKEGQPIAKLDEHSVRTELLDLQKSVKQEDGSYNTPGSYDSLVAPTKCRIKYLPVKEGDDVLSAMNRFGALAIVSADGWMQLTIETDELLQLGKRMKVQWDGGAVDGTVSRVVEGGYVILVPDERAPYNEPARLMDGEREVGSGTLLINMPIAVLGYSGTIDSVKYKLNESVPDGREIFELKNASPSISFEIHYESRDLFAKQLTKLIAYSADPTIYAEQDGIISEISLKAGERTGKSTNPVSNNVAYTLATDGATKMSIDVDELDILKIPLDATAEISLEALSGETLPGKVTAISKIGKKNNSISTFPVELTLDPDERLLAGMNGSATILIDRVENVLLIPVEAIGEDELGAYVNVTREDGTSARVPITTGKSDGKVAEVTSGLSEGDTVTYKVAGDLFSFATMGNTSSVTVSTEDGGDGSDSDVVIVG